MQKFKKTDSAIMYDFKNIDSLEWYDSENIADLQKWGYKIVLANKKAADYAVHFNTLIHDNIDMCKGLLPDWIKWEYIKSHLHFVSCCNIPQMPVLRALTAICFF